MEDSIPGDVPVTTESTDTASTMKGSKIAPQYFIKCKNNNSKKWDGKILSIDEEIQLYYEIDTSQKSTCLGQL